MDRSELVAVLDSSRRGAARYRRLLMPGRSRSGGETPPPSSTPTLSETPDVGGVRTGRSRPVARLPRRNAAAAASASRTAARPEQGSAAHGRPTRFRLPPSPGASALSGPAPEATQSAKPMPKGRTEAALARRPGRATFEAGGQPVKSKSASVSCEARIPSTTIEKVLAGSPITVSAPLCLMSRSENFRPPSMTRMSCPSSKSRM